MQAVVGQAAFQRLLMPGGVRDNGRLQFIGGDQFALQMLQARRLEGRIFVNMDAHDAGIQRKAVQARNRAGVNMRQPRLGFCQLLQNLFLFQAIYQHHFCNARRKPSPIGWVQSRPSPAPLVPCGCHFAVPFRINGAELHMSVLL